MSSEIFYDKAFILVGEKYIPVVNHGSSNCFDFDSRGREIPEKHWSVLNYPHTGRMLFTAEEMREIAAAHEEANRNNRGGTRKSRNRSFEEGEFGRWILAGMKSAHTVEDYRKHGNTVTVVDYDRDYWQRHCVSTTEELLDKIKELSGHSITVSFAEIDRLIRYVNGDEEMQKEAIPQDSDRSAAIGESLSRALLEKALRLSWCHESTTESALWLVNIREKRPVVYKRIVEISPHDIYLDNLRSKSELIAYLHENGPTHSTLMDFCADYRERYHNELCWNYPISDGLHLGTFFVLVKEGVLAIPYDDADKVDYELLCLGDAKMCDRESMENLISEWDSFNRDLRSAMQGMIAFYRREEEHHGSEN